MPGLFSALLILHRRRSNGFPQFFHLRYRLVLQDQPLSDHGLSPEFLSYRSGSYDRCCKIPSHFLALYRLRLLLLLRLLYAEMPQSLPEIQTPYRRQNNGFLKFFLVSHRLHLLLHRSRSYGRLPEFLFHPSGFSYSCCSIPGHFPVPHRSLLWLLLLLLYEQDVEFPFVVPGLSGIQNSSFRLSIPWIHRLVRSLHRLLFCGRLPESFCDNLKLSRRCCNIQECFLPLRRSLLLL